MSCIYFTPMWWVQWGICLGRGSMRPWQWLEYDSLWSSLYRKGNSRPIFRYRWHLFHFNTIPHFCALLPWSWSGRDWIRSSAVRSPDRPDRPWPPCVLFALRSTATSPSCGCPLAEALRHRPPPTSPDTVFKDQNGAKSIHFMAANFRWCADVLPLSAVLSILRQVFHVKHLLSLDQCPFVFHLFPIEWHSQYITSWDILSIST